MSGIVSRVSVFALVLAGLYGTACEDALREGAGETQPPGVVVVGASRHDFGRVVRDDAVLTHAFRLRNETERDISIRDIRKSCGCLNAAVESMTIAAGGELVLETELDTRMVSGKREAVVLVLFEDAACRPLNVSLDAFVEAPYRVSVAPLVWAVAADLPAGSKTRRVFEVSEFASEETDAAAITRAGSSEAFVRVAKIGEWKVRGWRGPGFARDGAMLLELEVPEGLGLEERVVEIFFERLRAAGSKSGELYQTKVDLLVRRL